MITNGFSYLHQSLICFVPSEHISVYILFIFKNLFCTPMLELLSWVWAVTIFCTHTHTQIYTNTKTYTHRDLYTHSLIPIGLRHTVHFHLPLTQVSTTGLILLIWFLKIIFTLPCPCFNTILRVYHYQVLKKKCHKLDTSITTCSEIPRHISYFKC